MSSNFDFPMMFPLLSYVSTTEMPVVEEKSVVIPESESLLVSVGSRTSHVGRDVNAEFPIRKEQQQCGRMLRDYTYHAIRKQYS